MMLEGSAQGPKIAWRTNPTGPRMMDQAIARMATDGERPLRPVKITHVEIHGAGSPAKAATPKPSAAVKKPM